MINCSEIARLIPHAGSMCLLHEVSYWDDAHIDCLAHSHLDSGNPLRAGDRLGILCGIEYAAQAMAVHGRLTAPAGAGPRQGFLASVRDVECHAERLDDLGTALLIKAVLLLTEGPRVIYEFSLATTDRLLMTGRAALVLP